MSHDSNLSGSVIAIRDGEMYVMIAKMWAREPKLDVQSVKVTLCQHGCDQADYKKK